MTQLAVDIVILPPEEITQLAIETNNRMDPATRDMTLNTTDCLPHITVGMFVVDENDFPRVQEILTTIAHRSPLQLTIPGEYARKESGFCGFLIDHTPELTTLHQDIITKLSSFGKENATPAMFVNPPAVQDRFTKYVSAFKTKPPEEYFPHITIGTGTIPPIEPRTFTATTLGLFQLGPFCTCARELGRWTFQ